jgi:hypothetical protein
VLDSPWLDIAIGVVFVWFFCSLAVSALNEMFVRLLSVRSKQLWLALNQMLDGGYAMKPVWQQLFRTISYNGRPKTTGTAVFQKLYATQTVQALENHLESTKKTKIHNIPANVFSQAMIEMGVRAPDGQQQTVAQWLEQLDEPLKSQMEALWATCEGNLRAFRAELERWFDAQMARLSAIYRSQIRLVMLVLGVLVTLVGFGAGARTDTLELVSDLQRDETFRTALSDLAAQASKDDLAAIGAAGCPPEEPDGEGGASTTTLDFACIAKGLESYQNISLIFDGTGSAAGDEVTGRADVSWPYRVLGLLVTAVAISFGASFWWNVLRRPVGLRRDGRTASSA